MKKYGYTEAQIQDINDGDFVGLVSESLHMYRSERQVN